MRQPTDPENQKINFSTRKYIFHNDFAMKWINFSLLTRDVAKGVGGGHRFVPFEKENSIIVYLPTVLSTSNIKIVGHLL